MALKANELIQNADFPEDLKTAFGCLREVITNTSENVHVANKVKKMKMDIDKTKQHQKVKSKQPQRGKYLSNVDKEIIHQGTLHSQKKFDCVEVYVSKGKQYLEEYTNNLVKEVRKHLAEENSDFDEVDEDDDIMAFIRHKVNGILRPQIGSLVY